MTDKPSVNEEAITVQSGKAVTDMLFGADSDYAELLDHYMNKANKTDSDDYAELLDDYTKDSDTINNDDTINNNEDLAEPDNEDPVSTLKQQMIKLSNIDIPTINNGQTDYTLIRKFLIAYQDLVYNEQLEDSDILEFNKFFNKAMTKLNTDEVGHIPAYWHSIDFMRQVMPKESFRTLKNKLVNFVIDNFDEGIKINEDNQWSNEYRELANSFGSSIFYLSSKLNYNEVNEALEAKLRDNINTSSSISNGDSFSLLSRIGRGKETYDALTKYVANTAEKLKIKPKYNGDAELRANRLSFRIADLKNFVDNQKEFIPSFVNLAFFYGEFKEDVYHDTLKNLIDEFSMDNTCFTSASSFSNVMPELPKFLSNVANYLKKFDNLDEENANQLADLMDKYVKYSDDFNLSIPDKAKTTLLSVVNKLLKLNIASEYQTDLLNELNDKLSPAVKQQTPENVNTNDLLTEVANLKEIIKNGHNDVINTVKDGNNKVITTVNDGTSKVISKVDESTALYSAEIIKLKDALFSELEKTEYRLAGMMSGVGEFLDGKFNELSKNNFENYNNLMASLTGAGKLNFDNYNLINDLADKLGKGLSDLLNNGNETAGAIMSNKVKARIALTHGVRVSERSGNKTEFQYGMDIVTSSPVPISINYIKTPNHYIDVVVKGERLTFSKAEDGYIVTLKNPALIPYGDNKSLSVDVFSPDEGIDQLTFEIGANAKFGNKQYDFMIYPDETISTSNDSLGSKMGDYAIKLGKIVVKQVPIVKKFFEDKK